MYADLMLTLIFLVLLWIALGLQVIASSIRLLGKLFKPTPFKLRQLERNTMPWVVRMIVVKVASHVVIRYLNKKMR